MSRKRWMNVEVRPCEPPEIDASEVTGEREYAFVWPSSGMAVLMSEPEMQELIARALVAQATEALV